MWSKVVNKQIFCEVNSVIVKYDELVKAGHIRFFREDILTLPEKNIFYCRWSISSREYKLYGISASMMCYGFERCLGRFIQASLMQARTLSTVLPLSHRLAVMISLVSLFNRMSMTLLFIKESRIPSPIQISIITSVLRSNVSNHPILSVDQPQN